MKIWIIRIGIFAVLSISSIVATVLNPGLLYANKSEIGNYHIYHDADLSPELKDRLLSIDDQIKSSELYKPGLQFKLCLNDGSIYPDIFLLTHGEAFGYGFDNTAVFRGDANFESNEVALNGYKWNLEQLFVHELTHCLQFLHYGLLNSPPIADHPNWKWEGYAEYVSRQNDDQTSLAENIQRLNNQVEEYPDGWGIFFDDGTVAPIFYYQYWLLVQYCLEIKGMTYVDLMESDISRETLEEEMDEWFLKKKLK